MTTDIGLPQPRYEKGHAVGGPVLLMRKPRRWNLHLEYETSLHRFLKISALVWLSSLSSRFPSLYSTPSFYKRLQHSPVTSLAPPGMAFRIPTWSLSGRGPMHTWFRISCLWVTSRGILRTSLHLGPMCQQGVPRLTWNGDRAQPTPPIRRNGVRVFLWRALQPSPWMRPNLQALSL